MVYAPPTSNLLRKTKTVKSLESFFKKQQPVLLAFLFGSFVSQRMHPLSDMDIAVLFATVPDRSTIDDLTEELSSLLRKEVDLVILNHAAPILKMQVLRKGILIYAKDRRDFHRFYGDTVNQYDDLKQIRRICEDNILKGRIYA